MEPLNFSWIDYTLFCLMLSLSLVVGIYYGCCGKQKKTANEYLLGGGNMQVFPIAMSLLASNLSGVSLLAIPTEVYLYGTQFTMLVLAFPFIGMMINYIVLPIFWDLQITTVFEYLELRFHKSLRSLASAIFTLTNLVYLPFVIYVPSLAFNQVCGFDIHVVALITSSICIFYTTLGGLKAVVWTDALQFSVTLCTLGFVLIIGIISVGGLGAIWEKAEAGNRLEFFNMNIDPTDRTTFWTAVIGSLFAWSAFAGINPSTTQRFRSLPSIQNSKKVLYIFITFTIVIKSICCFSGLIMYAKYKDCDPLSAGLMERADQIVPYYVLDVGKNIPGLGGLFTAGLFSAALSTLSTYLNTIAGVLYIDFVEPFMPKNTLDGKAQIIMKVITILIGLLSVVLIFVIERLGNIIEILSSVQGATLGPLFGVFLLGVLCPKANKKGAICGMLGSSFIMFFIIGMRQMYVWNGIIKSTRRPLSTEGCNMTLPTAAPMMLQEEDPWQPFFIFRISFYYYIMIGCFLVLIIGLWVSWITKEEKTYVNPLLLCPMMRPNNYDSQLPGVEKKLLEMNNVKT